MKLNLQSSQLIVFRFFKVNYLYYAYLYWKMSSIGGPRPLSHVHDNRHIRGKKYWKNWNKQLLLERGEHEKKHLEFDGKISEKVQISLFSYCRPCLSSNRSAYQDEPIRYTHCMAIMAKFWLNHSNQITGVKSTATK